MVRRLFLAVLVLGLVVAAGSGWLLFTADPEPDPPVETEQADVVGAVDDGWQELSYGGLRVEVPPGWTRMDGDCESVGEHWGPTGLAPCSADVGVWFHASATFDPINDPGVHPVEAADDLAEGGFGGYVTSGDLTVYAQDVDQEVVRRVLRSVREPTSV